MKYHNMKPSDQMPQTSTFTGWAGNLPPELLHAFGPALSDVLQGKVDSCSILQPTECCQMLTAWLLWCPPQIL